MKNVLVVSFTIVLVAFFATSCATFTESGSTVSGITIYALSDVPNNCTPQGTITTADLSLGQVLLTIVTIGLFSIDFSLDYQAMAINRAQNTPGVNAIAPLSKRAFEAYECP